MVRALAFLACIVSSIALADDTPSKERKLIELGEIRRGERLTELQGGLNLLKARLHQQIRSSRGVDSSGIPINAIHADHQIKATQERIDAVQREMDSVRTVKVYYPNIVLNSLHVGDIGILVDQYGVGATGRVATIVDDNNVIVTFDSQTLWLKRNTRGLKIGRPLDLSMPLEVTGTTTHKSIGRGGRKFFVLEPFHFREIDPEER